MGRIGALVNAVINRKKIAGPLLQADRQLQTALAMHTQVNRPHGTNGRTTAAQRALLLAPENLPGQIFDA
jgi:hypothetical protein